MALSPGEVDLKPESSTIDYTGVSNGLTVTCGLDNGAVVGGHLSRAKAAGALASNELLPAIKEKVAGAQIIRIHLAGDLQSWCPELLNIPMYNDQGESNYRDHGDAGPPPADMTAAVRDALGAGCQPTTEDRTGEFTIDMNEH